MKLEQFDCCIYLKISMERRRRKLVLVDDTNYITLQIKKNQESQPHKVTVEY